MASASRARLFNSTTLAGVLLLILIEAGDAVKQGGAVIGATPQTAGNAENSNWSAHLFASFMFSAFHKNPCSEILCATSVSSVSLWLMNSE
jgi:hypothetical protein